MSSSVSVNKKIISVKYIKLAIICFIFALLLNIFFILFFENKISDYLKQKKYSDLSDLSKVVSNDVIQSDFRTARNKLTLLKSLGTFNSFLFLDLNNSQLENESVPSSDESVKIPIYFPKTNQIHSYIQFFYSNSTFQYTIKIFTLMISFSFFCFFLLYSLSIYIFLKNLYIFINDYEILFESILTNPNTKVTNNKNPFFPTILKLKETLIKNKQKDETIRSFENEKFKFNLSKKLAHDIRSPISTLNLISNKIENTEVKELYLLVITQINNISDSLLNESKNIQKVNSTFTYDLLLEQLSLEYEYKNKELKNKVEFHIDEKIKNNNNLAPVFLYAGLNNLIENSIEACTHLTSSNIKVIASLTENMFISIEIVDFGIGIPHHILIKLGKEEISFGKKGGASGNGIGVFNLCNEIKKINGTIKFESIINTRTTISIKLPLQI